MYVHVPVLLEAVLELLAPPAGEACLVDATLGEGGHTEAFLSRFPRLRVVGVDKDGEILRKAEARLAPFGGRVRLVQSGFADFFERGLGELRPERILMDLGVSMFHFEQSGRGFSFRSDEPLDMRLDSGEGRTAAELLQEAEEGELARLLEDFGEEPRARRIAAAIVRHRERQGPVTSSGQLARIVAAAAGPEARHGRTHPATRTFQALRIAVNDELEELARALPAALRGLSARGPDGRDRLPLPGGPHRQAFLPGAGAGLYLPPGMADLSMWGQKPARLAHPQAGERDGGGAEGQPRLPQRQTAGRGEETGMKKAAIGIGLALVLGGLLFLNTWQGYRFESLKRDVQGMEAEQRDWLEQNKKLVAAVAVLSSPERIQRIAEKDLALRKPERSALATVVLPEAPLE